MILEDILESAGAETKPSKSKRDEIWVCCPFCTARGETEDTRYRLGVNLENGSAHCFNCEWKSGGLLQTARKLCHVYGVKFNLRNVRNMPEITEQEKRQIKTRPKRLELPEEYEFFVANFGDALERKAFLYLTSRGVTRLQIIRHQIGYSATGFFSWRIVFPVMDEKGDYYGFVGRAFTDTQPKYLNSPGLKMLWGTHIPGKRAVVVEGVMDALKVEQALWSVGGNSVALARLGTSVTDIQLEQLKRYEEIIAIPDWDRAGVFGVIEFAKTCEQAGIRVKVPIPDDMNGADPGSMTEQQILQQIAAATPWSTALKYRIHARGVR